MSSEDDVPVTPVTDSDLAEATGGVKYIRFTSIDKFYRWNGPDEVYSYKDVQQFLCPNCKRIVHKGTWGRWYCDPCNESWFYEDKLLPNLADSRWCEVVV